MTWLDSKEVWAAIGALVSTLVLEAVRRIYVREDLQSSELGKLRGELWARVKDLEIEVSILRKEIADKGEEIANLLVEIGKRDAVLERREEQLVALNQQLSELLNNQNQ